MGGDGVADGRNTTMTYAVQTAYLLTFLSSLIDTATDDHSD